MSYDDFPFPPPHIWPKRREVEDRPQYGYYKSNSRAANKANARSFFFDALGNCISHCPQSCRKDLTDAYRHLLETSPYLQSPAAATSPPARTEGLLGEHQRIIHAKAFKRGKHSLRIRSVRAGFGTNGGWRWELPCDRDGASAVCPITREPVRAEPHVPVGWVEGVAHLDDYHPPTDVPPHRRSTTGEL
jgi:hypothetical protein